MPRARHSSVGYSFFIFFFSASPALRRLPFLLIQLQNQLLPAKINKQNTYKKLKENSKNQHFWHQSGILVGFLIWFLVFVVVFHSLSVFFYRSLSMSIVYHLSCFRMFAFYYLLWKLFLLVFLSFSVFPSNGKWKVYSRCIRWYLKGTFKVYWN